MTRTKNKGLYTMKMCLRTMCFADQNLRYNFEKTTVIQNLTILKTK